MSRFAGIARFIQGSRLTKLSLAVSVLALMGVAAFPTAKEVCSGFLPPNNMKIPVGQFTTGGITKAEFDAVLDRVDRIYAPDIERLGAKLQVRHLWDDPTVNASATQQGKTWIINMYGGLARHAAINVEGMALVACHEIGHHMGGAPKISSWFSTWATNEGGSDYFATSKCLRRFFAEDDNKAIVAQATIDPLVQETCTKQFTTEADQYICMRSSLAGDSVAVLFQALRKETTAPKYGTPDSRKVTRMDDNHPATQCRMDTYFAGLACSASVNEGLSNDDYRTGTCYAPRDTVGNRPQCWFFAGNN